MNRHEDRIQQDQAGSYGSPLIKAIGLHLLVAMLLFVSFSSAPEFEPAKPIVQATLVQLNSKSPATTQTDQRIAGEAARTAAARHEAEELQRQQQQRQEQQEATRRQEAEQQRQAAARAEQDKQAEAARQQQAEQAAKQKEAEAAEAQRKADAARKLAAEEEARKRAQAEAEAAKKQQAAEEARRRAAEEEKRKAAAAEAARKAEADRAAQQRREQEEARAKALAELLASETQYQQAQADQVGNEVAASFDDVIRRYVSEQWRRPPSARNGMVVEVRISMLPTGQITDVVVSRSSGDAGFDQSAVQAVRNVNRIPEMQQLSRDDPATFDRLYRQRTLRFKPEDLAF